VDDSHGAFWSSLCPSTGPLLLEISMPSPCCAVLGTMKSLFFMYVVATTVGTSTRDLPAKLAWVAARASGVTLAKPSPRPHGERLLESNGLRILSSRGCARTFFAIGAPPLLGESV